MSDIAFAEDEAPDVVAEEITPRLSFIEAALDGRNLAEGLDDSTLAGIGDKVVHEYEIDLASRKEAGWDERYQAAMKLALLTQEAKTYPWPKASNVKYPLITTAAIQFNARAYPAIVSGYNIVKGKVLGRPDPQKQDRAERIGRHMSYQLLEEMDGWEEDTDRLLMALPIVGCVFRKTWFDPIKGYNCAHLVMPDKFVVNYWAKDLDSTPRATHELEFYPHEIEEKVRGDVWLKRELGQATGASGDDQAPHCFLEQYRLLDLDEDGYPEPYTVTVHKETRQVVRIVARFDEDGLILNARGEVVRITPVRVFTKYGFVPAPDGSFYDIGFGTLLSPLQETINSTINQLMDAGHLANVQGGFIGAGASIKSGSLRFQPGEWKKIESVGALKDNVFPLPVKEPSAVLFNLLGLLIEATKEVTATQDVLTGDAVQANQPVGTTLAMIEQGLKVFTAIYKRIHRALKHELACLFRLNRLYLTPEAYFTFQDEQGVVAQADYAAADVDVIPVSDPTVVTDMQRVGRAQFEMQFLGKGLDDMAIMRRALEAAGSQDIDKLFPKGPAPPPPQLLIEEKKLQQQDRKLDIEEAKASADVAQGFAAAEKTTVETMMAGPQMLAFAKQLAMDTAAQVIERMEGANEQVQPPGVRGMGGQPADQALSPLSPGSAPGPQGPLGPGPGNVGPGPDQGPPDGGAGPVGV